jgi:hypothetical protein
VRNIQCSADHIRQGNKANMFIGYDNNHPLRGGERRGRQR